MTLSSRRPVIALKTSKYKPIESGSYGNVFKIIPLHGSPQVIKRVYVDRDTDFIGSIQEIDFLARMNHPNIVKYTGIYHSDEKHFPEDKELSKYGKVDLIYLGMEFGLRSGDSVFSDKRFSWKNKKNVFKDLLKGIEYMHSIGVVHRDIKISNFIQVKEGNRVVSKWCDFGGAFHYTIQNKQDGDGRSTYMYRAPEIIYDKNYGTKIDIWSFGCVIAYMMSRDEDLFFPGLIKKSNDEEDVSNDIMKTEILKMYPREPTDEDSTALGIKSIKSITVNRISYKERINFKEVSEFNKSSGSYKELLDLLNNMIVLNPKYRYTVTQSLKHPFFGTIGPDRKELNVKSSNNDEEPLTYETTNGRLETGLYIMDNCNGIKNCFRPYEIMFHSMRLWDELSLSGEKAHQLVNDLNTNERIPKESLLCNMCIYLPFKLLNDNCDVPKYSKLFSPLSEREYKEMEKKEYEFVKDILKSRIYDKTPLEWADKVLSGQEKLDLFDFYIKANGKIEINAKSVYEDYIKSIK